MKFISFVAFGALTCISISLTAGNFSTTHASTLGRSIEQKGVSIQSRYPGDFGSREFQRSVDNAARTGVNYITLVIPIEQDTIKSNEIHSGSRTPTDDALRSGITYINSIGLQSAVAVHVNSGDGIWRAHIKASNARLWFDHYSEQLNHYGTLAESAGASQMIIGTELSGMTAAKNTNYWNQVIDSLRTHFNGSLTYSAQRSGYLTDAQSLGFWPKLDAIGLSAYYKLGSDTSPEALTKSWDNWNKKEVAVLAAKYNKPVLFTEIGYVSKDGATIDPGAGWKLQTPVNTDLQATAYEALLSYWSNQSIVKGIFIWDWSSDPNAGGMGDGDYTPQNKPAEKVMQQYFLGAVIDDPKFTVELVGNSPHVEANAPVTTSVLLSSDIDYTGALVDVEIYNSAGLKTAQYYISEQNLSSTPVQYSVNWMPFEAGDYTVKVGVFTDNWQKNMYWNNSVGTVTVNTVEQSGDSSNSQSSDITVLSPIDGSTLTRSNHIFSASLASQNPSTYRLYWHVDGGQLNEMSDASVPEAGKQSRVDMSNWYWQPSNQYVITFVAKDLSGTIIDTKSSKITLDSE